MLRHMCHALFNRLALAQVREHRDVVASNTPFIFH